MFNLVAKKFWSDVPWLLLVLVIFALSRLWFLAAMEVASGVLPWYRGALGYTFGVDDKTWLWVWANSDGGQYLSIASFGYEKYTTAFFPLYPLAVLLLAKVSHLTVLRAGLLISWISGLLAVVAVYKIALLDYSRKIALLAVLLLVFFPLSFYLTAVYPDGLFLLLTTMSFYMARKKRWLVAVVLAGAATFCRLSGLALWAGLVVEWFMQNWDLTGSLIRVVIRQKWQFLAVVLLPWLGIVTYMLFLWKRFGDPLIFQKAMVLWGQNKLVSLTRLAWRYIKIFALVNKYKLVYWIAALEFVSFCLYMALGLYVLHKVRLSYGVFMLFLLLIVPFTGTLSGTPRYLLHLFPAFVGLAVLFSRRKLLLGAWLVFSLCLGLILAGYFTRGYFVS